MLAQTTQSVGDWDLMVTLTVVEALTTGRGEGEVDTEAWSKRLEFVSFHNVL